MSGELTTEYKRARDATRKREDRQAKLKRRHEIKLENIKAEDALELARERGKESLTQQKEVSSGQLAVAGERSRGAKELRGIASPTDLAQIPGMKAESAAAELELTEKKRSLAEERAKRDAFNLAEEEAVIPKTSTASTATTSILPKSKNLRGTLTTAEGKPRYLSAIKQLGKSIFLKDSEEKKKRRADLTKRFSRTYDYLH